MDKSKDFLLKHPKQLASAIETQRMIVRAYRTDVEPGATERLQKSADRYREQAQELLNKAHQMEHRAAHAQDLYEAACDELARLVHLEKIVDNPQATKLAELERLIAKMAEADPDVAKHARALREADKCQD